VRIQELYDLIDSVAPFRLQESYDNAGLIVGSMDDEVRGVLLCLDVTHETVEEASRMGANLIVSHHPPIFDADHGARLCPAFGTASGNPDEYQSPVCTHQL